MAENKELKDVEQRLKAKLIELRTMYRTGQAPLGKALMLYDEELEAMYSFGLQLLRASKNKEAAMVLSNLAMLEPYDVRHWRLLGLSLQKIERAALALAAFEMALILDSNDIATLAYRGEVYILLGRKAEAARDLNRVIVEGKAESKADAPFVQRAKGLLRYTQAQA
jgi:Flp pilus assembly protein TadD